MFTKILTLLLLVGLSSANVDMAPFQSGSTEYIFVSWIDGSGDARAAIYDGGTLISEIGFADRGMVTVGICEDEPDSLVLMLSAASLDFPDADTLYSMNALLNLLDQVPLTRISTEHGQCGLIRHPNPLFEGLVAGYQHTYFSSGSEFYWFMQDYAVESGHIVLNELLSLFSPYPLLCGAKEPFLNRMVGPVTCQGGRPMFASDRTKGGGMGYPPNTMLMTLVHNPEIDSLHLLSDTLASLPDTLPYDSSVLALGSCTDAAVLLWADGWGNVHFSDYNCSEPAPISTETYPWSFPAPITPCAMSCDPDDEGLLLVWRQSGDIRCRHYQDGWNEYDRIVRTAPGSVSEGNIAVCSAEEGYWVAWLNSTDRAYPELQFVFRDSVTSIGECEYIPVTHRLTVSPNPFSESLSIEIDGLTGPAFMRIYELSGRLIHSGTALHGSFTWMPTDLSPGTYLIAVDSDGFSGSRRVVLLD